MRIRSYLTAAFILVGCGSAGSTVFDEPEPDDGEGGGGPRGGAGRGGTGSGATPELGPPVELASGQAALVGVTSDGWAVFRDSGGLSAVEIDDGPRAERITDRPGSVLIRGRVVFNWADVDWENDVGDLMVWSAEGGAHEIGPTPLGETLVGASEDGGAIVYTTNTSEESTDLVLAASDLSSSEVLVESMGLGSEETCGASIGFVQNRLFVAWCDVGSRSGRIERFDRDGDTWERSTIASDALPNWSADRDGERVFYLSSAYRAYCAEGGHDYLIDTGVSRGFMFPDGSALLYTVGDQLRRTGLPDVNPVPVVTTSYSVPVEFSPTFEHALFSTTVSYESGTQRDLLLVPTDAIDAAPLVLVDEPVARLGRSTMTRDGRFVLYLLDDDDAPSLHVVAVDGSEKLVLPNVVDVLAAYDSTIVFTDNQSDPEAYPVVSDLKIIDVAVETEPRLVEEKVLEARAFQVNPDEDKLIYVRSGVDREAMSDERDGLFYRALR
jgi:hypothetical protein